MMRGGALTFASPFHHFIPLLLFILYPALFQFIHSAHQLIRHQYIASSLFQFIMYIRIYIHILFLKLALSLSNSSIQLIHIFVSHKSVNIHPIHPCFNSSNQHIRTSNVRARCIHPTHMFVHIHPIIIELRAHVGYICYVWTPIMSRVGL